MGKSLVLKTRYFRTYPPEKHLGYAFETYKADLDKSALLLIDVYGIGFNTEKPLPLWGKNQLKIVEESLLPALNAARRIGMKVIYLNNSAPKINLAGSEFGKLLKRHLNADIESIFSENNIDQKEYHYGDSDHVRISKLLYPKENEYFIRKHVYSGFVGTRLDLLLRHLEIHNLFMAGFSTHACVFTTIADAIWHNYKCILLRDCTSGNDNYREQAKLLGTKRMIKLIESLYCVSIKSTEFVESIDNLISQQSKNKKSKNDISGER